MAYAVVAEGKANELVRTPSGGLIRVSKRRVAPADVAAYWNDFWRPKLGKYMGALVPVQDPVVGAALRVDEVGGAGATLVAEFKPKWLHQSPAAPRGARACRTCAVKAMRGTPNAWCSLDLAAKDAAGLRRCMQSVARPEHAEACARLLETADLLDTLALWQARLAAPETLGDCMSLRDCTVLIEFRPGSGYACWLVDLDPKDVAAKRAKWARIEAALQPYYVAWHPVCRLSRGTS